MPTNANLGKISAPVNLIDYNTGNELVVNADGSLNITANIGTTGGLALDSTVAKLNISQGTTLSSNTGPLVQGSVTTGNPTYITGQISPLSLTTIGALRTDNTTWLGSTVPTVGQKTSANSIPVVLPSDQTVNVSLSQSTDLDNGRVFYASVDSYNLATAGSANNPIFLMKNPLGSGKTMYLFSIIGNCKIANVQVTFYLYANPTITSNGTTFTPVNAKIGSGITSGMQIFTASTISSLGTLVVLDQVGQNSNSEQMVITQEIEVPAGQTVLVSGNPFSNNRTIITAVGWVEK